MLIDRAGTQIPLGYELNAHPGESLLEFEKALRRFVIPVRDRLGYSGPTALAPRIGRDLLLELETDRGRDQLDEWIDRESLAIYTVNAFPLQNFHARRVKEEVYRPDWTEPERRELSCRIVDVLAHALPPGANGTPIEGTVSTSGGGYRAWGETPERHAQMAREYLAVVVHLAKLERERGITIRLTAEPEPDTTFEVASDVIDFWNQHLLPQVPSHVATPLGLSVPEAESALHRFWNVNLDVCHQSVVFHDPVEEWKKLDAAGIRVGKLHITSALRVLNPSEPTPLAELARFDEPRYLHQWVARTANQSLERGADLDRWLALTPENQQRHEELRVHFHVPVSATALGSLSTTRDDTERAIQHSQAHADPPQLAIETYTWPLLADHSDNSDPGQRDEAMIDGIAEEFRWTLSRLGS